MTAFALICGCRGAPVLPDHPHRFAGVEVKDVRFHSTALARDVTYRVYMPSSAGEGNQLAVVYLLHGAWENYRSWSNFSDAGSIASRGVILVMPDGGLSYWVNAAQASEDKYGDFLLNDLRSDVEQRFPARRDRAGRAIVGVSMGGYGAIEAALTRPDLFAFAGALSPAIDAPERRFSWRRLGQSLRLRRVFGADGDERRQAEDPFKQAKTADPGKTPFLYLAVGQQEPLLLPVRRFAQELKVHGYAHEFHTTRGEHGWETWNQQTAACFEKMMEVMASPSSDADFKR